MCIHVFLPLFSSLPSSLHLTLSLSFPLAMAGNIIPAIATTNAVIAGLIVMEALKVLSGDFNKCKQVTCELLLLYIII